jgi:transcriptional regulator with XRE-family HTH domain
VKARVLALYQARRFKQVQLAERLGIGPSAVNPYISGDREISLELLEAVCDLTHERVAEIVAPASDEIRQLSPDEAALLRHVRAWPLSVRRALLSFVEYFADEAPTVGQTRNLHELWRRSDEQQRGRIFALAALEVEKGLSPDTREALARQLLGEADAAIGRQKKRP